MPSDLLEEQALEKNPNLELAQIKFLLSLPEHRNDLKLKASLIEAIRIENMAPWYEQICAELNWQVDDKFLQAMQLNNEKTLKKMQEDIEDAEKTQGDVEVRDAYLKRAEYYSRIGDKDKAIFALRLAHEKTISLGHRLDIVFHMIRIGLFFLDHDLVQRNIDKAKFLIEEGGDWDRRNRLKVYQGLYSIAIRDFKTASSLFLDTVSTFTSYELMDYFTFVRYTVYVSMISLSRNELRDKIIRGSEILEVLHSNPNVRNFLSSLYECRYADFFQNLAHVEELLYADYIFNPHYRFYVREMRIMAYAQLLESYRSLTVACMAEAFGVTESFIDKELSEFIASGRLHCKIDKVHGIVETNRPDSKNWQYQAVVKQGDLLLNRIQKLSRVINI